MSLGTRMDEIWHTYQLQHTLQRTQQHTLQHTLQHTATHTATYGWHPRVANVLLRVSFKCAGFVGSCIQLTHLGVIYLYVHNVVIHLYVHRSYTFICT